MIVATRKARVPKYTHFILDTSRPDMRKEERSLTTELNYYICLFKFDIVTARAGEFGKVHIN